MRQTDIQEYLSRPYARVLVADETGGYTAQILEFPGCFAEGDTAEEAIRNLDDAMADWIETVIESEGRVPDPLESQGYSGRLVLRMPKSIHKQAVARAVLDGVSLNQWMLDAIAQRMGAERRSDELARIIASEKNGRPVTSARRRRDAGTKRTSRSA